MSIFSSIPLLVHDELSLIAGTKNESASRGVLGSDVLLALLYTSGISIWLKCGVEVRRSQIGRVSESRRLPKANLPNIVETLCVYGLRLGNPSQDFLELVGPKPSSTEEAACARFLIQSRTSPASDCFRRLL
jgi:hypothetical protein